MPFIIVTFVAIINDITMARPTNPDTSYKITLHVNGGYRYATTRPLIKNEEGKVHNKSIHWGKVTEDLKFIPGSKFIYASSEERSKLIFPKEWDLSEIYKLESFSKPGRPANEDDDKNRFYGDIWLLEKIAETTGIKQDLLCVFDENKEIVNDILTLSMYPYVTTHNYNRVARWQLITKTPSERSLTPCEITRLTQSITEQHRMDLFRLRSKRVTTNAKCAMDSTTRSAYGDSLADIKWGHNKEKIELAQTTEVVVYTIDDHMPIYYRCFQGNIPDSRTVDIILADIDDAGYGKDLIYITDRGYTSIKVIEQYILADRKAIMCIKAGTKLVRNHTNSFAPFGARPAEMEFDTSTKIYYKQFDIPYEVTTVKGKIKRADRLKLNLYFDPIRRGEEQVQIDVEVSKEKESLEQLKKNKTIIDQNIAKHDYPYYNVTLTKNGRVKSYVLNEKKRDDALKDSGFTAILSYKLNYSPIEVLNQYAARDEQEKYFQQMKSQMVSNRQRTWSEEGKAGRLLILFVSMILGSYLRYIWKTNKVLKDNFPSSLEMLDEMRSIRCIEHKGRANRITPFVGDQHIIADTFGYEIPKGCEPDYKSKKVPRKRGRPRKNT